MLQNEIVLNDTELTSRVIRMACNSGKAMRQRYREQKPYTSSFGIFKNWNILNVRTPFPLFQRTLCFFYHSATSEANDTTQITKL